jgi:hypothetical protein
MKFKATIALALILFLVIPVSASIEVYGSAQVVGEATGPTPSAGETDGDVYEYVVATNYSYYAKLLTAVENASFYFKFCNLNDYPVVYNFTVNNVSIASNEVLYPGLIINCTTYEKSDILVAGVPASDTYLNFSFMSNASLMFEYDIDIWNQLLTEVNVSLKEIVVKYPVVRIKRSEPALVTDSIYVENTVSYPAKNVKILFELPPTSVSVATVTKQVDEIPANGVVVKPVIYQKKPPIVVAIHEKNISVNGEIIKTITLKVVSYENTTARFELEKEYFKGIDFAKNITVEVNGVKVENVNVSDAIKFKAYVKERSNTVEVHYSIPAISVMPPAPAQVIEEKRGYTISDIVEAIRNFFNWIFSLI